MSLRSKVAWIVAAVVIGYAAVDHWIQRGIVLPRFESLERDSARTDALRVRRALLAERDALDARCSEWATWDETCEFLASARDGGPEARERAARFERSSLGLEAFRLSRINLLYVVDADGTVRWGRIRDLESGAELALRELALDALAPGHPWLVKERPGPGGTTVEPVLGLALTELGPMFVASRPIVCGGDRAGTLIFGRLVADELVGALALRTEVVFETFALDEPLEERDSAHFESVSGSAEPHVVESGEALAAYTLIDDLRGRPALLVRATIPREIAAKGEETARYALVSTVASGFLLLLVLLFVLRRTVVDPLSALTRHAVEIGRTDDWSRRVGLGRADEIGTLSRELDSMMEKLERSRTHVVDAARTAGMSEIATGILHDVGNVLNSVNVSADLAAQRLRASKLPKLEKLLELVEAQGERLPEFLASSPKGRHVVPFLGEATRALRGEHDEVERELRSLAEGIEHIRRLVDSQQALAGASELREPVDVGAQVELAWSLVRRSDGPTGGPELVRDIEDVGRVRLDRHKLVQVLVNLLKNARESHAAAGRPDAPIRARVARHGAGRLAIEIADDGVGIAREDLERIFRHGVTTKPGGHGFGLHSCANAITEMDGSIRAESAGPGRGARFVVELPFDDASPAPAPTPREGSAAA
jgi:two-component system NtrC family sensor kinase